MKLFNGIYNGKTVLVTGHTGFKGSWLSFWLTRLGARVIGYSLEPPTEVNHFEILDIPMESIIGDIRDLNNLLSVFNKNQPDIVFHLAAQPLVRYSYKSPVETYATNVMGTVNILEASRQTASVQTVINITSDKCYQNREWLWGYRENEPMGGEDPYSSSKGCAELITIAYRKSFFSRNSANKSNNTLLASVRAGNVIGGGDWAEDRLLPDIMKATKKGVEVFIRNPSSTRPWQHVLDPLSGYLLLAQRLMEGEHAYADGWNFGPKEDDSTTVLEIVQLCQKLWPQVTYQVKKEKEAVHEANLLKLDCSKARSGLNWVGTWATSKSIQATVEWYREYYNSGNVLTEEQLNSFIQDAHRHRAVWTTQPSN